jgi:hypothetical protein
MTVREWTGVIRAIAVWLRRSVSTVSRELCRQGQLDEKSSTVRSLTEGVSLVIGDLLSQRWSLVGQQSLAPSLLGRSGDVAMSERI